MTCNFILNIYIDNQHKEIDLSNFSKSVLTLGKNKNNDIIINSNKVSENQLILELNDHNSFIGDMSGQGILYKGNVIREKRLEVNDIFTIGQGKKVSILITEKSNMNNIFYKYTLDNISLITIGKDETNNIILGNDLVSNHHAQIIRDKSGNFKIVDLKSRNGVFVNGKRITEAILNLSDTINILGHKIIFNAEYLSLNNVSNNAFVKNLELYLPKKKVIKKQKPQHTKEAQRPKAPYPYFQKSPRFIPEIPTGDIEIISPPFRAMKPDVSWLAVLLPSVTMIITTLVMMLVTKGGAYVLVTLGMTLVSVFISIHNYQSQLKKYNTDEGKRKKAYIDYLNNIKTDLNEKRNKHQKALREIHPDLSTIIKRVEELDRRLWERNPSNDDFLDVRIGIGSERLKGNIKLPRQEITINEDPLFKEPQKLIDEYSQVEDIPISVSISKEGTIGIIGNRDKMNQIARNMAIQIAASHSYDEVKIICIFPEKEASEWEWIRWLPHTWDDNRQVRFMIKDKSSAHEILTYLYDMIKMRENLKESNSRYQNSVQLPYLVFFLADTYLLQYEPIMNYLIHNHHALGISGMFFFERLELLPKDCQVIIEASSNKSQMYKRESLNNKISFSLDQVSVDEAEKFARTIAPIRLKQLGGSENLPKQITFLDIFSTKTIEELEILERWKNNKVYKSLAVPIGKKAGNDNLILDIHEKFHGPHGLIAGTTGSGKSELIQTYILSLAVNYHPHDVSFVLIDYKGGGMANSLNGLPHIVGTITNLGGNETRRALLSIKSEIHKRQSTLSKYGFNNIDQYIPLYKEKKAEVPLPHLIIIVDEFAELKAEQPDFMKELVSTARVGRSLGIHLILATQKPSGVVDDQIWSNSRFKLCLKVQDASDSQEVIKRTDAAYINITGRGFIQVGNNEMFEEFQSAWSGAQYIKEKGEHRLGLKELNIINLDGSRRKDVGKNKSLSKDRSEHYLKNTTQLKTIVEYISKAADNQGIYPLRGPWLPTLPERLYLQDILNNNKGGWNGDTWYETRDELCPILGLMDNPSEQQQELLSIDLGKEGHLAIYGAPGTGKTNSVQTLITSLVLSYNPEKVNIYIIDFGSRAMGVFSDLPHLGGVVFPEEDEKLSKLSKLLMKELNHRKIKFSEFGVSNLISYIKASGVRIPAIVLVIDNYSALSEMYPDIEDVLVPLSREGGNYGIHLILTANSTNGIRFKVSQNIKSAIALQMIDKSDYTSIVGRTEGLEPENYPGRGLVKFRPPLEIQISLPIAAENQYEMTSKMRLLFKEMAEKWRGRKAKAIPFLPDILTISELLDNDDVRDKCKSSPLFIPLGLDLEEMRPVGFDLADNHCFMISGTNHSGKTSLLKTIAAILENKFESMKGEVALYIIDSSQNCLAEIGEGPIINGYINDSSALTQLINSIIEELNIRKRALNQVKGGTQGKFDAIKYILEKYPLKVLIIDDLMKFIEMIDDTSKDNFERIIRFGKGLGVYIVITGEADDINKLSQIDTLTKAMIDLQNGVILGGNFDSHNIFNVNIPYQERSKLINIGEGYIIKREHYIKTKIVIK